MTEERMPELELTREVQYSLRMAGWTVLRVDSKGKNVLWIERNKIMMYMVCVKSPEKLIRSSDVLKGVREAAYAIELDENFKDKPMQAYALAVVSDKHPTSNAIQVATTSFNLDIRPGIFKNHTVYFLNEDADFPELHIQKDVQKKTYLGVHTCKGGVGKTTISAHLAGAFAIFGKDVALLDLDPQKNLTLLLSEGAYLYDGKRRGGLVNVYNAGDLDAGRIKESIIVVDTSPDFDRNPSDIISKFDYVIMPTTLNPSGINRNGDVIIRTLEAIRKINDKAFLFVLINNYMRGYDRFNSLMIKQCEDVFGKLEDEKFKFIYPAECAIQNSKALFQWGIHMLTNDNQNSLMLDPGTDTRKDFSKLVEFLEVHNVKF